MSVRSEKTVQLNPTDAMAAAITEAQPGDSALAEHANFNTNNAENPLTRSVVVSVRASLNELCLQKQRGTWAPSAEAMRSIMQSRKYTGLDGSAEAQGDLKVRIATSCKLPCTVPYPSRQTTDLSLCNPNLSFFFYSRSFSTRWPSRTSSRPSRARLERV
jgi:hypothetical protein